MIRPNLDISRSETGSPGASFFQPGMPQSVSYLEIGNSTAKLLPAGTSLHDLSAPLRFSDPDRLLERLSGLTGRIVCAPIGERLSGLILPRIPETLDLRVIERADLAGFVGDSYDTPATIGLDRVLNLIGLESDAVVISCGTAITIDMLAGGVPRWGAIMPGFRAAARGLADAVPILPEAEPAMTPELPARSSLQSVVNGVLLSVAFGALGIARELAGENPRLMLTGGDAPLMARLLARHTATTVDDLLTMRGMAGAHSRRFRR